MSIWSVWHNLGFECIIGRIVLGFFIDPEVNVIAPSASEETLKYG